MAHPGIPDMQFSPESLSSQQVVINLQIHLWKTGLIPNTLPDTLQNPSGFVCLGVSASCDWKPSPGFSFPWFWSGPIKSSPWWFKGRDPCRAPQIQLHPARWTQAPPVKELVKLKRVLWPYTASVELRRPRRISHRSFPRIKETTVALNVIKLLLQI